VEFTEEEFEGLTDREKINYTRRRKTVKRIEAARAILNEGGFDGYVSIVFYSVKPSYTTLIS
jgi:hypothetical protein